MNSRSVTGIIWLGPVLSVSGYGTVSRTCLRGLASIGVPVRAINDGPDDRRFLDPRVCEEVSRLLRTDVGRSPVAVVHAEPSLYPKLYFKHVVKRIGYTIFETDRIPPDWVGSCQDMEEVWVPSRFNRETFAASGVDPAKLRVVPYGVDTEFFRPIGERLAIPGLTGFCFLYVFAYDWRKGFDLLVEAYRQEFRAQDDVTLVLKTQSGKHSAGELERVILGQIGDASAGGPDLPRVIVLTEPKDLVQLRRLYNTCDLYVSTDRANGWGMPCMEAMAMGKPAATIDWSGSTEFMTAQNSFLIKPTGRLVPVDARLAEARPIYRGQRWAEVTVDEVRRVLRMAYAQRDDLARVARQGMQDVRERYSHVRAAERMRDHLLSVPVPRWRIGAPGVGVRRPPLVTRAVRKAIVTLAPWAPHRSDDAPRGGVPSMRVGFDVRAASTTHDGIGRYAMELTRALLRSTAPDERPDELVLFAENPSPDWLNRSLRSRPQADGTPDVRVETRYRRGPHETLRAALFLGPTLGRSGIRIFHSPHVLGAPLTSAHRVALVVTVHDLIPSLFPEAVTRNYRWRWSALLPLVVRRADRLIVDSHATARDLAQLFPRAVNKIRVVHLGVAPRFVPAPPHEVAALRARLGLPSAYLLSLGTLSPRKNLDRVFEACALLRQRNEDIPPLVIAGQPGWLWKPIMQKVNELGLRSQVVFSGFVPDDDLPALLTGAALFVLPSLYEGFGLPVLEAMACGAPVVTSDRSSLPEVAGDAAVLIDPRDPEAIADGIRRLLHDDLYRAELRRRGFERVRAFRWEDTARKTVGVYREVMNGR